VIGRTKAHRTCRPGMFCLCRLCDLSSRVAAKSDTSRTSFRSIAIGNPLEMSEFHRLRCERRSWADWVQELAITGRPSYQELPLLVSALSIKVWATTPGAPKELPGRSRQCVGLQFFQGHKLQSRRMGGVKIHRRGHPGLQRFMPTGHAKTPAVSFLQPRKTGLRCYQIIAACVRKFEKFVRHLGADGMKPDIARAGAAVTIPIKTS
jgi:hypothetical protein